jgi:hypothetical protein
MRKITSAFFCIVGFRFMMLAAWIDKRAASEIIGEFVKGMAHE